VKDHADGCQERGEEDLHQQAQREAKPAAESLGAPPEDEHGPEDLWKKQHGRGAGGDAGGGGEWWRSAEQQEGDWEWLP